MFERLKTTAGDVVGLTESYQYIRHFQSFFLLMNRRALDNDGVRQFWDSIQNLNSKLDVIKSYEIKFTYLCEQNGLETRALFPRSLAAFEAKKENPTIIHWRDLLRVGFPYIKIELVRDWLTYKGLAELKRLIVDPELAPYIDSFAALRTRKRI